MQTSGVEAGQGRDAFVIEARRVAVDGMWSLKRASGPLMQHCPGLGSAGHRAKGATRGGSFARCGHLH